MAADGGRGRIKGLRLRLTPHRRATGGEFATTPVMPNARNESPRKKPEDRVDDRRPAAEPQKPESGAVEAPVGQDDSLIGAERLPRKGDEEMSP